MNGLRRRVVRQASGNQEPTGDVHTNHQAGSNGHIALAYNNGRTQRHKENRGRGNLQNDSAAGQPEDNEDYGRVARLIRENRNLRKLLMECYQVQRASHKLKLSIFNERLRQRVESAIKES